MILVVDASVAVKWFVNEPRADIAMRLLASGHELAAPDYLRIEVGNTLLKSVRAGRLDAADAAHGFARLDSAFSRLLASDAYLPDTFAIAARHGGSLYDAAYISTATLLERPLVTDDERLVRTAVAAGVRVHQLASLPVSIA